MKDRLKQAFLEALARAQAAEKLPQAQGDMPDFVIETPRSAEHGDLATNLAMQLARVLRMKPRDIAEALVEHLGDGGGVVLGCEIAGPGFINLRLSPVAWMAVLPEIMAQGDSFGSSDLGQGNKAMVEFVSANPTGPLHVGHGRGAVLGDSVARLLTFTGHEVCREYYINDAGTQMATLGRSLLVRARQEQGADEPFPDKHYQGEYMKELAREFLATDEGQEIMALPEEEALPKASHWAGDRILGGIKDDLAAFGVKLDSWFPEHTLMDQGKVAAALDDLTARDQLYEADGALWFRAENFGDEKDRVVRRSSGELTYFASDIAYHRDKLERGYERLIDVWGADHHGYVPRLKAVMSALGQPAEALEVILVQMVNLLRGGEPVAMSTRAGEFVTLREVVDEVGRDAARFIFLTRRSEAPLDFDLEVAKAQSMDNPVYYVQYAHTRVMAILRKAGEAGVEPMEPGKVDLAQLTLPEEVALARKLGEWVETVAGASQALEPHRLSYYLGDLAGQFHSYYNAHRVLDQGEALTQARLLLTMAVGQVLRVGLGLMGVSAPETM